MSNPPSELPAAIEQLQALFFENLALQEQLEAQVNSLESRLAQAMGKEYARCGIRISADGTHRIVEEFHDRVETVARKELSVRGGPFDPETQMRPCARTLLPYGAEGETLETALEQLSPVSYWRILAASVDPAMQRARAARDAAVELGKLVGLVSPERWHYTVKRNPNFEAPKVVRGCVELDLIGTYVEEGFDRRRLGVTETTLEAAKAIQYALDETGFDGPRVGDLLHRALLQVSAYGSCFTPRERIDVGGGASIMTFVKGTKLYLPQEIASAINLFVSEQLAEELAPEVDAAA